MLISATEGWRQYVPLVVSVGVILDILLGSPIANLALGPMVRKLNLFRPFFYVIGTVTYYRA